MSQSGSRFDEWECYKLSDCDFDKQCQGTPGRCIDPCTNNVDTGRPPCGINALCEATRYKAICSCPKTHTGDPFVSCRPFTPADLCSPNPCGPNAYCKPGTDNLTGEDRPVCLCEEGYRGNGVTGCVRGDCISLRHDMCPDSRACYDSTCVDPCGPTFCGGGPCCNPTANCRGVQHKAECSCPAGTVGEPRTGGTCVRSGSASNTRVAGSGSASVSLCNPLAVERPSVMKDWTGLVNRDLSALVREVTAVTPWWLAGEGSASMIASVLRTELVLTTSVKIHARVRTPLVEPTLTARW